MTVRVMAPAQGRDAGVSGTTMAGAAATAGLAGVATITMPWGGTTYGVFEDPVHFGSGGGPGAGHDGGAGGGVVRLTVAGNLKVDGAITANGLTDASRVITWGGGGGSGGSICFRAGTLSGAGLISAEGGDGHEAPNSRCGGGGGGRIAIYTSRNNFFGIVSADGGDGHEPGQEGTIHYGTYNPGCGDPLHPYPIGDLNGDCRGDMFDVAILCSHWLESSIP